MSGRLGLVATKVVVWLPRLVAPACGSELCNMVLMSGLAMII